METGRQIIAPFNNPLIRFISDRKFRWLRHTLFITIGLILAFKGDIGTPGQFSSVKIRQTVLVVDAVSFVFIMSLIYLMIKVLIPKLLFQSKLLLFAGSIFVLIVMIYLCIWWLDSRFIVPVRGPSAQAIQLSLLHFIQVSAVCGVLLGSVMGMVVFKKWINDVQRMNELHETNLKTELEQLKSQVNPHFLFNTLNNLLVLVKTDTGKASQVLLGLSDLLRYQLYDSNRDKIILTKDIEFIQNLLALEKIRKNDFSYTIHTDGPIEGQSLPPFLFIPFVENAIKHGASTVGHSYLTLRFNIENKQLHFSSENSKPSVKRSMIGGLGLGNIRRRLELLYPEKHTLEIQDNPHTYIVNLIIAL